MRPLTITPVSGLPELGPGDDLALMISAATVHAPLAGLLADGGPVMLAQGSKLGGGQHFLALDDLAGRFRFSLEQVFCKTLEKRNVSIDPELQKQT